MKYKMQVVLTNPDALFDGHGKNIDYAFSLYMEPQTVDGWLNVGWVEFEFDAGPYAVELAKEIARQIQSQECSYELFKKDRDRKVAQLKESLDALRALYPDEVAPIADSITSKGEDHATH